MKKKIYFVLMLLSIAVLSYLIIQPRVRRALSFFWSQDYFIFLYLILGITLIMILLGFYFKNSYNKYSKYIRYISYFAFFPVVLFPLIRCYFNIPYIFCSACPRRCPWGEIRKVLIPSIILINLDCRSWCYKMCPLGLFQDQQCLISPKKFCLPKNFRLVRYLFLIFTVIIVIITLIKGVPNKTSLFFNGNYDSVLIIISSFLIIFITAFFIPRFWCNYFCPVGTIGDLALRAKKLFKRTSK